MDAASKPAIGVDLASITLPIIACIAVPGAGVIAAALIVAAFLVWRRAIRNAVLVVWWRTPVASLALGVGAGVVITAIDSVILEPLIRRLLHSKAELSQLGAIQGHPLTYIQLLVAGFIVGGLLEELVFRGFLIGWTTRVLGRKTLIPAILLSSALFGYSHLYQGLAGMMETAIVGLMLAILYAGVDRRLAPSAFAHMTIDAIGITDLFFGGPIAAFINHNFVWL